MSFTGRARRAFHPLPRLFMGEVKTMAKGKNSYPGWFGSGPFSPISDEMRDSGAWKALKPRQRALYVELARQYRGKSIGEVGKKYPDIAAYQRNDLFFYPWRDAFKTGLYGKSIQNDNSFRDDIQTLCGHGLIKKISRGYNRRMTIYQFSIDWKRWKPPPKQNEGG